MSKVGPGLFMLGVRHHPGGLRDSELPLDGAISIARSIRFAQIAGQGLCDMAFLADQSALNFNISTLVANAFWEA